MLANITKKGGKVLDWFSADDEQTYNKILPSMPDDWRYRNESVSYKLNSQGYRTKEWHEIDWPSSTIVIGCSYVFGLGINEHETLCSLLGDSFVNLGVSGSSNHLMFYNSMRLIEQGIKPKSVILMFSDPSRYTHFNIKNNYVVPLGHWSIKEKEHTAYYRYYSENMNCNVHGTMMAVATEAIWKNYKVPTLAYSAYSSALKDKFKLLPDQIDFSRELNHPGTLTNKIWAEFIGRDLSSINPTVDNS
jgi:hypothetical protein